MATDENIREHPEASFATYIWVWAGLMVLTVLTVVIAGWELGQLSLLVAMLIAATKATLVVVFFMHLRYEKIRLYLGVLVITLVTFGIFVGLTFTDIAIRYQ
jgi:cytochrome c oxidase subunit 4